MSKTCNMHTPKITATIECRMAYIRYTISYINTYKATAILKRFRPNTLRSQTNCKICDIVKRNFTFPPWNHYISNIDTSGECCIADFCYATGYSNTYKSAATSKRSLFYTLHTVGNCNTCKTTTIFECPILDARCSWRNYKIRDNIERNLTFPSRYRRLSNFITSSERIRCNIYRVI